MSVLNEKKALELLDGDRELLLEIWQDYLDESKGWLGVIERSLKSGDHETLEREAHSLKSSSGSVGAEKLSGYALKLELAAKGKNKEEYENLYRTLKEEFVKVIQAIGKRIESYAGDESGGDA